MRDPLHAVSGRPSGLRRFAHVLWCAWVRAKDREVDLSYPEVAAAWVLRAFLALMVGQIFYVAHYQATSQPILLFSALTGLLASGGFLFIPTNRPRTLKLVELGMLLSFCLHVAGHLYGWYFRWTHYDTYLHGLGAFVVAGVGLLLSQAIPWVWNWRRVTPFQAFWFCTTFSITMATLWEIMEFGMDTLFGTREQDDLFDTMLDFVADALGAFAGASLAALLTRYADRHGADSVAEQPKPDPVNGPPVAGDLRRGAA